jgi:AAA domain-containing protein/bifunctional DNA primase/polymerase-like protein
VASSTPQPETTTPANRHDRMVAAAELLARTGFARIGWAALADGKAAGSRSGNRWQDTATDDPALVVGLLHGARNALVIPKGRAIVIDIDDPAAFGELEAAGLPPTLTIDSPTPGHGHVYGWVPEPIDMATIPGTFAHGELRRHSPRTDTASMVLGPWALRTDGAYTPRGEVRTIAELPASVIDYLITSARTQDAERKAARGPEDAGWTISRGRHDFLKSRARNLRGVGLTGDRLVDELLRLDRERNSPPLADDPNRGETEIRRIAGWTDGTIPDDPPGIRLLNEPQANGGALRFYTPQELAALTLPSPDWLVRLGLAAIGSITEIDGKIKAAGKTTLILWMVRAVLDGAAFLGEPTRRARVLYVTEQSRQTFMDSLRLAGLAERGDELRILFREDFHGAAWPAIVAACRIDGYELVVIDTIGKLAGIREENSAGEWSAAMSPLQDLAASGRAVIVARHDRKSGGEVGDSGRGSSQASGDVDIILAIRRPEGHQPGNRRVIESLSRYRETPEKIVVELMADGYVLLGTAEAVAAAEADSFVSSAIGSEFRTNGIGPDLTELAALGDRQEPKVRRTNISAALARLYAAGQIERSGAGKKGDPYRYTPTNADSFRTQNVENESLNESETDPRPRVLRAVADDDYPSSAWDMGASA